MAGKLVFCCMAFAWAVQGAVLARTPTLYNASFDDIETEPGVASLGIEVQGAAIPYNYHNNQIMFSSEWTAIDLSSESTARIVPPSSPNCATSSVKTVGNIVGYLTAPRGAYFDLHRLSFACVFKFATTPEPLSCDVRIQCNTKNSGVQVATPSFASDTGFATAYLNYLKVTSCQISITRATYTGGFSQKNAFFLMDDIYYDIGK